MNVTVHYADLADAVGRGAALALGAGIMADNSLTKGMWLDADADRLVVGASNFDVTYRGRLPVYEEGLLEGACCLPSQKFAQYVKAMRCADNAGVTLSRKQGKLALAAPGYHATFATLEMGEQPSFPESPDPEAVDVVIDIDRLARMAGAIMNLAEHNATTGDLTGKALLFRLRNGALLLSATDADTSLAFTRTDIAPYGQGDSWFYVPAKNLAPFLTLKKQTVAITRVGSHLVCHADRHDYALRLVAEKPPQDVEGIAAKPMHGGAVFDRRALDAAVTLGDVFTGGNTAPVADLMWPARADAAGDDQLDYDDNVATVSNRETDEGGTRAEVACETSEHADRVRANARTLHRALQALDTEQVRLLIEYRAIKHGGEMIEGRQLHVEGVRADDDPITTHQVIAGMLLD